jgi:hypothetical protein
VDDACRRRRPHGHHLQQTAVTVGADHEEALFPLVLVLDQPQRVSPGMRMSTSSIPCRKADDRISMCQLSLDASLGSSPFRQRTNSGRSAHLPAPTGERSRILGGE